MHHLQSAVAMVMLLLLATTAASVLFLYILLTQIYPWILQDIKDLSIFLPVAKKEAQFKKTQSLLIDVFEDQVRQRPDQPFLLYKDEVYSYREMDRRMNQVARAGLGMGLSPSDVVALFMENSPATIWAYYGEILNSESI